MLLPFRPKFVNLPNNFGITYHIDPGHRPEEGKRKYCFLKFNNSHNAEKVRIETTQTGEISAYQYIKNGTAETVEKISYILEMYDEKCIGNVPGNIGEFMKKWEIISNKNYFH